MGFGYRLYPSYSYYRLYPSYNYWEHLIRDEVDFNRHVDYIHWNPVKHGYVTQVSHWPYLSFHWYAKRGWLPANWGSNIESLNGADFGECVGADTRPTIAFTVQGSHKDYVRASLKVHI